MNEHPDTPSGRTYHRHFGAFGTAVLLAGYRPARLSIDAAVQAVRWVAERLAQPNGQVAVQSLPASLSVPDELLLLRAGYDPETGESLDEDILLGLLAETVAQTRGDPDKDLIKEDCPIHPVVYEDRFESLGWAVKRVK